MSFALLRAAAMAAVAIVSLSLLTTGLRAESVGLQRSDDEIARANSAAADAAVAIRDCDYEKWGKEKQSYDYASKAAIEAAEQFGHRVVYDNVLRALKPFPLYPFPCHPPEPPPPPPPHSGGAPRFGPHPVFAGAQPFVGVNIGGGFQNTAFTVDPPFNVNSNGVIGGGFGGVLFPLPGTNLQVGFRVGGEGGNLVGDIKMPAASPAFTYKVTTTWTAYQEGFIKFAGFKIADNELPRPQDRVFFNYDYFNNINSGPFVTGSLGIAESGTSVKGTSGMFSVIDDAVRTGFTFTAGVGVPVAVFPNGNVIDLFTQYRGTVWSSTVNIPGMVGIGSFTNEVDVGATLHFTGLWDYARH